MSEAGWTAVALSRDLEPGAVAGVIVEGREWALWRSAGGRAHLWEDRCPHRGMRMSFGFVRGERLACLYHGWQYDEGGQCRYIPAHPDLEPPATIRLSTVEAVESGGLVWASFDGGAGASPALGEAHPVRSLYLDVSLDKAVACLAAAKPVAGASHLYEVEAEGAKLRIAAQPVDADHCALHIVALAAFDAEATKRLALWAQGLRRKLEGGR